MLCMKLDNWRWMMARKKGKKKAMDSKTKRQLFDLTSTVLRSKLSKIENRNVVMGFDLSSTATGWVALIDGEVRDSGTFGADSHYGTYAERDRYMYDCFVEVLEDWKPGIICIEQVSVFRDPHAVKMLIEVQACLHIAMDQLCPNALFFDVTTTQIKKVGSGDSKADKADMLKKIEQNWKVKFADHNEGDAYCAALCGRYLEAFLDHYEDVKAHAPQPLDTMIRDFHLGRHNDTDIPSDVYEVLIGALKSEGMRPLKNNDVVAYYEVRAALGDTE